MDAKHQFKYTYNETDLEEHSPVEITFEMPGEATLTQMLNNFESYLKACGFYFDGHLEFVNDFKEWDRDILDDSDEYFNNGNGLRDTFSSLEAEQKLKEWNEGIAKLDAEVAKNKWVHGICNPKCK